MQVTALQALTAPMLVDSYSLQRAVLESDIPDAMLASLEDVGVEGLGLLAGGLRKPISVERPLLSKADWQGIGFQTFPSELQTTAIAALGADPTEVVFKELDAGLADGSIDGFEKNLLILQVNDLQLRAPHVTVNVSLWPETVALIADPDLLGRLSDEQRRWVREAASAAVDASSDLFDDQAVLDELCETGAIAAEAAPAQLEELRAAFAPVYEELRRDQVTARYLDEIAAMKAGMVAAESLEIPDMCSGQDSADGR
jgi:TRAP-type C4-dicarboxylate transport system substrate-binding protein